MKQWLQLVNTNWYNCTNTSVTFCHLLCQPFVPITRHWTIRRLCHTSPSSVGFQLNCSTTNGTTNSNMSRSEDCLESTKRQNIITKKQINIRAILCATEATPWCSTFCLCTYITNVSSLLSTRSYSHLFASRTFLPWISKPSSMFDYSIS